MKNLSKKVKMILTASLASVIGVTSIITPIAINYSSQNFINNQNSQYSFNGQNYDSLDDVMKYVDDNTSQKEVLTSTSHMWSMNTNGKNNFYYSADQVTQEAFKNINVYDGYTSMKYSDIVNSKGSLNEVSKKTIAKMDLQPVGSSGPADTIKVYQGKNDSIFTDEDQAKKTFYSIHEGYNFDGIYFRNKTDLRQYLDQANQTSNKSSEYFTIKNPIDTSDVSLPISTASISQLDFNDNKYLENEDYIKIRNFVQNSATSYVSVKNNSNNYKYFDINDNNILSEIIPYISADDIGYTKVESSNNRATYIVDVSKEDDHGISGPYFYSGGGNILSSNDKDQWSKFETVDDSTNASPINEVVSGFTDILLNESSNVPEESSYYSDSDKMLFYFYEIGDLSNPLSGVSLNKQWHDLITLVNDKYFNLYKRIIETYDAIKQTKKFNGFYKLPIIFTLLVQGLIRELASNDEIMMVRNFFNNLCLKMDKTLSYFNNITLNYGFDILKNLLTDKDKFSFVNFFKFNNPNYDLSSDINAFLSNMIQYYPNLILFIVIANVAIGNSTIGIDVIDPFINDMKKNIKLFGLTIDDSVWNNKALPIICNLFSTCSADYIYELLKPYNSNLETIDIADSLLGVLKSSAINFYLSSDILIDLIKKDYSQVLHPRDDFDGFFIEFSNTRFYDYLMNLSNITLKEVWKSYVFDKMITNNLDIKTIPGYTDYSLDFLTNLENYLKNNNKSYDRDFLNFTNMFYKNYAMKNTAIVQSSYKQINLNNSQSSDNYELAKESLEKIRDLLGIVSDVLDWVVDLKDSLGQLVKLVAFVKIDFKSISAIILSVKDASNVLSKVTRIMSYVGIAFSVASFLLDLFLPETKNYSYQFKTNDGTTFTWNGGQKTTTFMGLGTISETTIDSMKFISPILIQDAYNESFIYSNGKKYIDTTSLIRDTAEEFIENESFNSINENIKKVYSLNKLQNNRNQSDYVADSIDELTVKIINSLKTSIKNNNLSDNYYYNSYTYKYANGYSSDLDAIIRENVDAILSDIQPVKIAMLPNIDKQTKTPIFDELGYVESKNDGSTNNFVLPGKVWNSLENEAVINSSYLDYNYIVVNPNVLVDVSKNSENVSTMTGIEAENLVNQKALNSFNVASKIITKQDFINATNFSKLTNTYDKYQIYEVNDSLNGTLYFLNQEDAVNYYFKSNNMKLHELTPIKYVYVFDNKEFESKNELYAYVKERIVEVK